MSESSSILLVQPSELPSLEGLGAAVVIAESGSDAIAKCPAVRPNVVIFPFVLTDMTGAELCRRVRHDPQIRSTSLLLIADRGHGEQVELCMAAGCNEIVFRPVDARELREKVQTFLSIPLRKDLRTLTKVEIGTAGEPLTMIGHSINISAGGMLLELRRLLAPEALIRVRFYLPDDPVPLALEGRVFRAEFDAVTPRYGLRFVNPTDEDRERIERYVQHLEDREAS